MLVHFVAVIPKRYFLHLLISCICVCVFVVIAETVLKSEESNFRLMCVCVCVCHLSGFNQCWTLDIDINWERFHIL